MKAKDLRVMTTPELNVKLAELKEELFNFRFQKATHQLENPYAIRNTKRDIARVLTILREREISEQQKEEDAYMNSSF